MYGAALITMFMSLAPANAPADAEIGTCLSEGGVWLGPWSDAEQPQCGADCGDQPADTLCDGPDTCLTVAEAKPRMPEPQGPRCLDVTAECGPVPASGIGGQAGATYTHATTWILPPPRLGLLPGAGPLTYLTHPVDRADTPPTPPPRA